MPTRPYILLAIDTNGVIKVLKKDNTGKKEKKWKRVRKKQKKEEKNKKIEKQSYLLMMNHWVMR